MGTLRGSLPNIAIYLERLLFDPRPREHPTSILRNKRYDLMNEYQEVPPFILLICIRSQTLVLFIRLNCSVYNTRHHTLIF
jgi:hypothetical protein